MALGTVAEIHTLPVTGEPGLDHAAAAVGPDGLEGDRRKKAPVHVVSSEEARFDTRANLFVTLPTSELASAVGSVLAVGEVELGVTAKPSNCPGVYAEVRRPGTVRLGDPVSVRLTVD